MITVIRNEGPTGALRAGVLLLLVLGVVGTAATLASERHWEGFWQMLPWVTLCRGHGGNGSAGGSSQKSYRSVG